MIDLLILAFVAKWFYELAKKYNRQNKWIYILLGILTYVVIGYGVSLSILILWIQGKFTGDFTIGFLPSLMAIPFGILAIWILYIFLERQWTRSESAKDELLDESIDPQNKK